MPPPSASGATLSNHSLAISPRGRRKFNDRETTLPPYSPPYSPQGEFSPQNDGSSTIEKPLFLLTPHKANFYSPKFILFKKFISLFRCVAPQVHVVMTSMFVAFSFHFAQELSRYLCGDTHEIGIHFQDC